MSDELFSYRLRKFRDEHGLSQEQMGAALGVTARYIGMMEGGNKDVEPNSALAKLFALMETNKVRVEQFTGTRVPSGSALREDVRPYVVSSKADGEATDLIHQRQCLMIDRIKQDTEGMIHGSAAQRRELAQLAKIHIDHFVSWLNASDV